MKNWGGHFTPELGGHFELESGAHFKLELGGQYHRNMQKEPIAKFIDKSIAEKFKGKITFTQLKNFIANSQYALYPESNLRTNIFLCCRRADEDEDLFIHQDFLSDYPNIKTIEKRNRYLVNAIINTIVKIIRATPDTIIEKNKLKTIFDLL